MHAGMMDRGFTVYFASHHQSVGEKHYINAGNKYLKMWQSSHILE
jgi:hypothetical protein